MHLNSPLLSPSADLLEERRNSSAEKPRKRFARKNPVAGERIRARLQRTGKKFCIFSAVGKARASAPCAFIPPLHVRICGSPYYQLVVVYLPSVTVALSKNFSSETCILPKSWRQHTYMSHLWISNRGGGVGRQIP